MKAGTALAAIAAVSLVAPAAASADVRYASPAGDGNACSSGVPCSLQRAVEFAGSGDEVAVLSGTYTESDELDVTGPIVVHGIAGQPAPVVVSTAATAVDVSSPGAELRRMELVHFGSGDALLLDDGVASQIVARTTSSGFACQVRGATLQQSLCSSTGAGGSGAGMTVTTGYEISNLRHVTAIGAGPGGRGLEVGGETGGIADLRGIDVIARASAVDIESRTDGASIASIGLDFSNYGSSSLVGTNAFATAPGIAYNQTDTPVFADPEAGDFHEHPDSPTIDRGTGYAQLDDEDVDGEPRIQGYGIDIGADEFLVGPPPSDTNPPDTRILKGPSRKTSHHHASFKFGTSEPAQAIFMCSVDGAPFKQCKSPHRVRVKRGRHAFRVLSIDAAGNVDPTPALRAWRVRPERK